MKINLKLKIAIIVAAVIALIYGGHYVYEIHYHRHHLTLYGNVDIKEVSASFRVPGRIKELFFDEGDFVREGQILAKLDTDTFSNDIDLAQANLGVAKSNLDNAKIKFERTKNLFHNDAVSKLDYDNDKASFDQAQANEKASAAQLKIAITALLDTNLTAPSDAYVLTRAFEKGSMIDSGQTIYQLSLTNNGYVRAYVDEEYLGKISDGMAVKIVNDAGNEYQGQIGFISPRAEFTPKSVETEKLRTDLVYRLRITIKNPNTKLKQGMPVTIMVNY